MALAQDNLPAAGVGYEIFDKSDAFGTTAFVQNINRLRALEGELARSIQTIDGIESARVHLVIPERADFLAATIRRPPPRWCSRPARVMGRGQVQAIQHLVAAAVAGLSPPIASPSSMTAAICSPAATTSPAPTPRPRQEDQNTTDYEDRLRQRIESIVASVVGAGPCPRPGRRRHELQPHHHHAESYDPDSKVVRSTQTVEQNAADTTGGSQARGLGRQRAARRQRQHRQPATTANPTPAAPRKPPITKSPRKSPLRARMAAT